MKKLLLCFVLLIALKNTNAQQMNWGWAYSFGGAYGESGNGITKDSQGNIYVAGTFQSGSINIGNLVLQNTASGLDDVMLIKFSPTGQPIWVRNAGSINSLERCNAVAVDSADNVIISGYFASFGMSFDSSTTISNSAGTTDEIFVAKYNSNGTLLWATSLAGDGQERVNTVCTDGQGNTYLGGWYGTLTPSLGGLTLPNASGKGGFVFKLNAAGAPVWVKTQQSSGIEEIYSVTCDPFGNVIATGLFQSNSMTVDGVTITNSNTNNTSDAFVVKYDSTGNLHWVRSFEGSGYETPYDVSADQDGNIYTSGVYFSPTFSANTLSVSNAGQGDTYIMKLDSAGNEQWLRSANGILNDQAISGTVNENNEYCVGGLFNSPSISSNGLTINRTQVPNTSDLLVLRYNQSGSIIGGSIAHGTGLSSVVADIIDAPNGQYHVTGYFTGQNVYVGSTTFTNNAVGGARDFFIAEVTNTFTGIEEETEMGTIVVYPNPASTEVTLQFPKAVTNAEIRITDLSGKILQTTNGYAGTNIQISMAGLAAGHYLLSITEEGKASIHLPLIKSN
jgi:Secretion system C-terminal sorting domain